MDQTFKAKVRLVKYHDFPLNDYLDNPFPIQQSYLSDDDYTLISEYNYKNAHKYYYLLAYPIDGSDPLPMWYAYIHFVIDNKLYNTDVILEFNYHQQYGKKKCAYLTYDMEQQSINRLIKLTEITKNGI